MLKQCLLAHASTIAHNQGDSTCIEIESTCSSIGRSSGSSKCSSTSSKTIQRLCLKSVNSYVIS